MTEMHIQPRLFTEQQTETTSDDYYTPKWIFDTLGLHFDLDVASPPHPTHVPCDRYFTQADDGLAQPWTGRVWMNPPFSQCERWVNRWINHANGIALLPLVKNTQWGTQLWNSQAVVHFPSFELKFYKDGRNEKRIWPPIWLWALGDDNIAALQNFGKTR